MKLPPYQQGLCVVWQTFRKALPVHDAKPIIDEVVRIAPLVSEPGLIGYECPACCYVTSVNDLPFSSSVSFSISCS
jgi:hypothetical protein